MKAKNSQALGKESGYPDSGGVVRLGTDASAAKSFVSWSGIGKNASQHGGEVVIVARRSARAPGAFRSKGQKGRKQRGVLSGTIRGVGGHQKCCERPCVCCRFDGHKDILYPNLLD